MINSHTYFHSASGTYIDLTLCIPSLFLDFSRKFGPDPCGSDHFPMLLENDGPPSLGRVQRGKLAEATWDQFQHLCNTHQHQSAIANADDRMSLFTSILKDIAEETIPKTSALPKRVNKSWFSDICKDAIKERNRALERFKREPTEVNLNAYRTTRAKARRDIRHSKKTSWRNYVSKMNSQTLVSSVWNLISKIKGNDTSSTVHNLSANTRDVTFHRGVANTLADNISHNYSFASVRKKAEKQTIRFSYDLQM